MPTTTPSRPATARRRFHPNAYAFVFAALQHTQQRLGRPAKSGPEDDGAHISGPELLDGIRDLAHAQFGLLAKTVFRCWNVESTADFGRIVFELVERGEMRKTDRDHLSDFFDVFDFDDALDRRYQIEVRHAFKP
jgi:uncharacterized repeat protein (TIGR04138 family)